MTMSGADLAWLWMPITVGAAFTQTLRNAAQRHLTGPLGTLGATLVRFLYGLPFAVAWLVLLRLRSADGLPETSLPFFLWVAFGAVCQIVATALLLRVMAERNFALGVAYSKTEVVQVAIFGVVLLGDPLSLPIAVSAVLATLGVMLISAPPGERSLRLIARGWTSRTALFGLASGATFALSAAGYRGAALALAPASPAIAAASALVWAQALQTVLLGGWLLFRKFDVAMAVLRAWRVSLLAGFMGALASGMWFTAMAMQPVVHVRTLGLVELLFSYAVSRKIFRERLGGTELAGIALLMLGIVGVAWLR
jgi:drug/metabolite transporter (DMT)-like permease